jgi:hypothetical protein
VGRRVDEVGNKHGRFEVLEFSGRDKQNCALWKCRCECGVEKVVRGSSLRSGEIVSCGCYMREVASATFTTHGLSRRNPTGEYTIWAGMKQRCLSPTSDCYADYGGRGITVCDRWKNDFAAFYEDMGPRPSPKHTLERKDNDGNYEPTNCIWLLKGDQVRNRRNSVRLSDGTLMIDKAREVGVPDYIVYNMRKRKIPINEIEQYLLDNPSRRAA